MIGQKRNDTNIKWLNGGEVPIASKNSLGIVQIGLGIDITPSGVISTTYEDMPIATKTSTGVVQIGEGIDVTETGEISVNYENIPIATKNSIGVVQIGDGIDVTSDGKISVELYTLPIASSDTLGGVKIGEGINIDVDGTISAQEYTLPIASADNLGGVKIGDGINIEIDGTISAQEYTLPIASAVTLGGVKIGEGINVTDDGTISAQEYTLPIATNETLGGVKIGDGINVTEDGIISAQEYTLPVATNVTLGGVIVGDGLTVDEDGTISTVGSLDGATIREHTDYATFLYDTSKNEYYMSEAGVKRSDSLSTGKPYMVTTPLPTYNNGQQKIEIWNGNKTDLVMNDLDYTIQRNTDGNIIDNNGAVISSVDGTYTIDRNGLYKDGTKIADIFSDKIDSNVATGENSIVTGSQNIVKGVRTMAGGLSNFAKDTEDTLLVGRRNWVANKHDTCYDNIINGENGIVIDSSNCIINSSSRTTTNPGANTKYYGCKGVIATGTSNEIRATDSIIAGGSNKIGTYTSYVEGNNNTSYTTTADLDALRNSVMCGSGNHIDNSDGATANKSHLFNSVVAGATNTIKTDKQLNNNIISGYSLGIGTNNSDGYSTTDSPFIDVNNNIISGEKNIIRGDKAGTYTYVKDSEIIGYGNKIITSSSATSRAGLYCSLLLGSDNNINDGVQVNNCVIAGNNQTITAENAVNAVWLSGNSSGSNIVMKNDGSIKAKSLNLGTITNVETAIKSLQSAIATKTVELVQNSIIPYADITEDTETIENATHTFTLPSGAISLKSVSKNDTSNTQYAIVGVVNVDGTYKVGIRMFENTDSDIIVAYTT